VKVFLDSSVVLASCGRAGGASRALFELADARGWRLLTSEYVIREVEKNVRLRMPSTAQAEWRRLRHALALVPDVLTFHWPVVFPSTKDKPVLFAAAAAADVLVTLDRADFGGVMEIGFYGLPVMKPSDFLRRERAAGRLE
jgi:predicted nucleic acid-binding protein